MPCGTADVTLLVIQRMTGRRVLHLGSLLGLTLQKLCDPAEGGISDHHHHVRLLKAVIRNQT